MNKLALDDLVAMAEYYHDKYGDDETSVIACVCMTSLIHYLGKDCTDQFFNDTQSDRRMQRPREYLRMPGDPDDSRDTLRRTDRIVLLAELLFNLQDIEGIDEVVTDI